MGPRRPKAIYKQHKHSPKQDTRCGVGGPPSGGAPLFLLPPSTPATSPYAPYFFFENAVPGNLIATRGPRISSLNGSAQALHTMAPQAVPNMRWRIFLLKRSPSGGLGWQAGARLREWCFWFVAVSTRRRVFRGSACELASCPRWFPSPHRATAVCMPWPDPIAITGGHIKRHNVPDTKPSEHRRSSQYGLSIHDTTLHVVSPIAVVR